MRYEKPKNASRAQGRISILYLLVLKLIKKLLLNRPRSLWISKSGLPVPPTLKIIQHDLAVPTSLGTG